MKFIAGVFVILALLNSLHCAPLTSSNGGTYKETEASSSWGYNIGLDANLGLEGGFKDGHGSLGIYKHLGANVGGHKKNGRKEINHPIFIPYYSQQYIPQYAVPYVSQYPPQWPQGAPHYIPQGSQQYAPQVPPHHIPQGAPRTVTLNPPQYNTSAPLDETQYGA